MSNAGSMRIATWNVNSLKARLGKVEDWCRYAQPDVLCLQETKLADSAFPAMAFSALGYESAHHGDGRWNGVAIVSRLGLEEVHAGFASERPGEADECRLLTARCGGVWVSSLYVPNGRSVGSEHYARKLEWLEHLQADLAAERAPDDALALCGDFNIAPEDRDVYDPAAFVGATHVSAEERGAFRRLEEWGLEDAFRLVYPDEERIFSWWDYRAGAFHKNNGMLIDHILVSRPLAAGVTYALIDREARKGIGSEMPPSDHAPVLVDVAIGPVRA